MLKSKCLRVILTSLSVLPFTIQASWHDCCCPDYDYSYNPPLLEPSPCGHGYVAGEYLLLRSNMECGTWGWATTYDLDAEDIFPDFGAVDTRGLCHEWNSGFRVALGYDFDCDRWGLRATYTYYHSNADDRVKFDNSGFDPLVGGTFTMFNNFYAPSNDLIFSLFQVGTIPTAGDIKANWKLDLNQIDIDATREYYIGCAVTLRPYVGFRYYNFDTKINTVGTYNFLYDVTLDIEEELVVDTHASICYDGFGLKSGLSSTWELGCGFGIYGDANIALVYGQFRSKNRFSFSSGEGPSIDVPELDFSVDSSTDSWCSVKAVADYSLGLFYRQGFNCDRSMFEVVVAWENHIFFNHNQFKGLRVAGLGLDNQETAQGAISLALADRCADISLAGLMFRVGLYF